MSNYALFGDFVSTFISNYNESIDFKDLILADSNLT